MDDLLLRIARHLMIKSLSINDLGLYHGKMGILLFFVHYAKYSKNRMFDLYANDLIDDILDEMHEDIPINFESGLCGIGWSIEYLIQNKFMEGSSDEILEEIDKKIMERNLRRISDLNVRTGLEGILYYVDRRLYSSSINKKKHFFDESYISDVEFVKKKINKEIPDDKEIISSICEILPKGESIIGWNLGIENGCAGVGLSKLLK